MSTKNRKYRRYIVDITNSYT